MLPSDSWSTADDGARSFALNVENAPPPVRRRLAGGWSVSGSWETCVSTLGRRDDRFGVLISSAMSSSDVIEESDESDTIDLVDVGMLCLR